MKISKNNFLVLFSLVVVVLAVVRCVFPEVARQGKGGEQVYAADTAAVQDTARAVADDVRDGGFSRFFDANGNVVKNRIYSVPRFCDAFPDSNSVQLESAQRFGVPPVLDRADAERRMKELVYIGTNPYYTVDKLKSSIPYLVPRAAILLGDIGKTFFDSLQIKGVPLHKVIVTSVLRTRADVDKLRNTNHNATVNSCHLYGTTFDICYNRYTTVSNPDGAPRRAVRNDTLKWVLSEVLRDMRETKRCYVKYEVKQGCFHITVR